MTIKRQQTVPNLDDDPDGGNHAMFLVSRLPIIPVFECEETTAICLPRWTG